MILSCSLLKLTLMSARKHYGWWNISCHCSDSNVLCYECDSRFDPSCAEPFGEGSVEPIGRKNPAIITTTIATPISNEEVDPISATVIASNISPQLTNTSHNNSLTQNNSRRRYRQLPPVQVCHGCCVKLTSKSANGGEWSALLIK